MIFMDFCNDPDLVYIIGIVKKLIGLIRVAIPILLIIWGLLDLGKAVIASKEDEMKKAQSTLIKRFMYAVLVFLITYIVSFALGLVGGNDWQSCWNMENDYSTIER